MNQVAASANLGFFAAESDQRAVLDFLFSSTDVRVFESYSEYDADLREFCSTDELVAVFPIGIDRQGNGTAVLLQLWSPSVMSELSIERFALDPAACNGHTFRHRIEGGALMQLYFGGVHERVITKSHFGHQSQIRAQKWDMDQGINWEPLRTMSNRIQYHIRKRLGVAKVPGCPVLPQAYELARSGYALKLAAQTPWSYELKSQSESRRNRG
jgi:hypothetical protein